MRKKSALHLDSRYSTMIENAYFYSNPPEARQEAKVKRPPMHEYIRKLLYRDLSKTTIERVLRQMRKLDWDNVEVSAWSCYKPLCCQISQQQSFDVLFLLSDVYYTMLHGNNNNNNGNKIKVKINNNNNNYYYYYYYYYYY